MGGYTIRSIRSHQAASFEAQPEERSPFSACQHFVRQGQRLVSQHPLGKNELSTMMVRVSEKVGLNQAVYTNHSVCATAISRLSANVVEDRHIMARHRTSECRQLDQLLPANFFTASRNGCNPRRQERRFASEQSSCSLCNFISSADSSLDLCHSTAGAFV